MSSSIALLRRQLDELVAPERPFSPALASGVAALDRALAGGFPRGRITELVSAGGGATTLVRHAVAAAVARGDAVGYVDATRTLAPRDWAFAAARDALWVVRPADAARGAWCADVLLRSGAFALVVLDGAPPLTRPVVARLTRLVRAADAALLVLGGTGRDAAPLGGVPAAGALRLRVRSTRERSERPGRPERPRALAPRERAERADGRQDGPRGGAAAGPMERRMVVSIEKGGLQQSVEVSCAVGVARRLCTHPEVPDRRGAGRAPVAGGRVTDGAAGTAGVAGAAGAPGGRVGARARRSAEPPPFDAGA